MDDNDRMSTLTLRPAWRRLGRALVTSGWPLLVLIVWFAVKDVLKGDLVAGLIGAAVKIGILAVLFTVIVAVPRVTLGPEGISARSLGGRRRAAWSEVSRVISSEAIVATGRLVAPRFVGVVGEAGRRIYFGRSIDWEPADLDAIVARCVAEGVALEVDPGGSASDIAARHPGLVPTSLARPGLAAMAFIVVAIAVIGVLASLLS